MSGRVSARTVLPGTLLPVTRHPLEQYWPASNKSLHLEVGLAGGAVLLDFEAALKAVPLPGARPLIKLTRPLNPLGLRDPRYLPH